MAAPTPTPTALETAVWLPPPSNVLHGQNLNTFPPPGPSVSTQRAFPFENRLPATAIISCKCNASKFDPVMRPPWLRLSGIRSNLLPYDLRSMSW